MAQDYVPSADADFWNWAQNFMNYASMHLPALGLTPADMTTLGPLMGGFNSTYMNHQTAQQAALAARQAKDQARHNLEQGFRSVVRRIQANPAVTNEHRAGLDITVRDTTPSMTSAAAVEGSRPIGMVDTSQRLRHEIRFVDSATPTSRAKPKGVMGCEIWVKIGNTPPADPSECAFLALDTASPYVAEYTGADANKTAYYMLRWVNTRGEKGPWSETVAATITG